MTDECRCKKHPRRDDEVVLELADAPSVDVGAPNPARIEREALAAMRLRFAAELNSPVVQAARETADQLVKEAADRTRADAVLEVVKTVHRQAFASVPAPTVVGPVPSTSFQRVAGAVPLDISIWPVRR